jgi:hypothetical protein
MAEVEVVMNVSACVALRNSSEVQADLLARAERIANAASGYGGFFDANVQKGQTRAHAQAHTANYDAMKANTKDNALLKSMDAGR